MGNELKILSTGYYNHGDQYKDRVIGYKCRQRGGWGEGYPATDQVCESYQLQLGTGKKGQYIDLFRNPVPAARPTPKPGDQVYYAPTFFLDDSEVIWPLKGLGKELPYFVRAYEILTRDELEERFVEMCKKQHPAGVLPEEEKKGLKSESLKKSSGNMSLRAKCLQNAHERPEDYRMLDPNPDTNPFLVYFKSDAHKPMDPRYVVKASADLINPEAKRLLKVAPKPSKAANPSPNVAEMPPSPSAPRGLLPLAPPDQFIQNLRDLRTQKKGVFISAQSESTDNAVFKLNYKRRQEHLARIEKQTTQNIEYLKASLQNYPEDVPKTIVALIDLVHENQGPNQVLTKDTIKTIGNLLGDLFKNPDNLAPLVAHIVAVSRTKNWKWAWRHRLDVLTPSIHNLMIDTMDSKKVPPMTQLAKLAEEIPDLTAPIAVVAAHGDDRSPETMKWFEKHFAELAKSPKSQDRMCLVRAAPLALEEKAMTYLTKVIDYQSPFLTAKAGTDPLTGLPGTSFVDPMEGVHLAAFEAMKPLIKKWLSPDPGKKPDAVSLEAKTQELRRIFITKGLNSPSPKIQFLCAHTMIEAGLSKDVAPILYKRFIEDVAKDPRYSDKGLVTREILERTSPTYRIMSEAIAYAQSTVPSDSTIAEMSAQRQMEGYEEIGTFEEFAQRNRLLETAVAFRTPGNKSSTPLTLRSLALMAIATSGGKPLKAFDTVKDLFQKEPNSPDLFLAADALVALDPGKAHQLIFKKLEQPSAPQGLFLFAINAAVQNRWKDKETTEKLYGLLFYPYSGQKHDRSHLIRQGALAALGSLVPPKDILHALIVDSKEIEKSKEMGPEEIHDLVRIADALGAFKAKSATERLLELAKNSNKDVRRQALRSLAHLKKDPKIEEFIVKTVKRDPELKDKLSSLFTSSSPSEFAGKR